MKNLKQALERLAKNNRYASPLFRSWLNPKRKIRSFFSMRGFVRMLNEAGIVASVNEVYELAKEMEKEGLGYIEKKNQKDPNQFKWCFTVPMESLVKILAADLDLKEHKGLHKKAIELLNEQLPSPVQQTLQQALKARPNAITVPLDRSRSVVIDLPEKFSAEDADLVAQFIRRQAD